MVALFANWSDTSHPILISICVLLPAESTCSWKPCARGKDFKTGDGFPSWIKSSGSSPEMISILKCFTSSSPQSFVTSLGVSTGSCGISETSPKFTTVPQMSSRILLAVPGDMFAFVERYTALIGGSSTFQMVVMPVSL